VINNQEEAMTYEGQHRIEETTIAPILPGQIVQYTLSDQDADQITRRRNDANTTRAYSQTSGFQVHVGNAVREGDVYPLVITRVWDQLAGYVNGQVLLDGSDTLWVTSVTPATDCWPSPRHYERIS